MQGQPRVTGPVPSGAVAVVGADGFLGAAAVRALRAAGHVVEPYTRQRSFLDPSVPSIRLCDTVFWLAGSTRPATEAGGAGAAAADLDAVATLLDTLASPGPHGRRRVVVASSGGTVYDPAAPPPHGEATPTVPANAYGEAMLAVESLVAARAPQWAVLRIGNAYGPGQRARRGQGVLAHWLDAAARGAPLVLVGDEAVARDYVHVDDVVDALLRVHAAVDPPGVLNVGSGVATSLAELLALVRATVHPTEVTVQRVPARGFDAPSTWLRVTRAHEVLGWVPRTPLAEGLAATWAHRGG